MKKSSGRASYYIAGSRIKNYTSGNSEARREIMKVMKFMAKNVEERLPRLRIWKAYGVVMNPKN